VAEKLACENWNLGNH